MDSVTNSLSRLLGEDYETVDGLAIFDEHEEKDKEGNVVRKFDKDRLAKIAENCNKRFTKDGSPAMIGPGHTLLDKSAPEQSQPPIWGMATDFRVGEFGPSKRLGILAKFYMKRQIETTDERGNTRVLSGTQALKEFPRPSVELWHKEDLIDWIALGRRRPERDLGLLMCAKNPDGKICYQKGVEGKLSYTMDPTEAPDIAKPDLENTDSEEEFNPEEVKQYERTWKYFCKTKGMSQYNAGGGPGGSAFMSPTNTSIAGGSSGGSGYTKETEEPRQMAATPDEVLQYQKKIDEAKAESAKLKAQVEKLEAEKAYNERVTQYAKGLAETGVTCDINEAEELAFAIEAFPQVAQFQRYNERLKANSKKKDAPPVNERMIQVKGKEDKDLSDISMPEAEPIIQYMRNHELDPEMIACGQGHNGAMLRYQKAAEAVKQGKR